MRACAALRVHVTVEPVIQEVVELSRQLREEEASELVRGESEGVRIDDDDLEDLFERLPRWP